MSLPTWTGDNVTEFDWQQMFDELDWLPGGGLNKAHEAIDRHANGPKRDKIAMIWEGKNGEREDYTFGDMKRETDKFANVLKSLGIVTGDRVFTFMDRLPEQYIAVFGILKAGAIAGPLFSAFGPDPRKGSHGGLRRQGAGHPARPAPQDSPHHPRTVRPPAHHHRQQGRARPLPD